MADKNPKTRRKDKRTKLKDWRPAFIEALACGLHVQDAAKEAGVHGTTPYDEREKNDDFRKLWNKAQRIGLRALKAEAHRRAFHGTLKPVYQGGKLVGKIREYSDSLMKFLIEGRDPKYRAKFTHEHTGKDGQPLIVSFIEVTAANANPNAPSEAELDTALD